MVHWVFILVGLAVGFFLGACTIYYLAKLARAYDQVMSAVAEGAKGARFR